MSKRLSGDEAELVAELFEGLFEELHALRGLAASNGLTPPDEISDATVRVMILNALDAATDGDLKGTALSDMPEIRDGEAWEWQTADQLVRAINHGMSALVHDLVTHEQRVGRGDAKRQLNVEKFRMAWETLARRQLRGDGATIVIEDNPGGEVGIRVLFEPPLSNPFKKDEDEMEAAMDKMTPAQLVVGNMMSYAFMKRNEEG